MQKNYPYLYETHLHTCQGSKCAKSTGREMAKAAKEAGYAGIFVTDHNWYGNCAVDNTLPWEEFVAEFKKGYEDAKAWGDANDFAVFFGYEAGYGGPEFLIYGITPEWLLTHPEIKDASIEDQYRLVHEAGGMVIQAHPYREAWYISEVQVFPDWVDGVEGVNAAHSNTKSTSHNNPLYDRRAIAYAAKYNLPMIAGSDIHTTELLGGGVAFSHKLSSGEDYCRAILSGEDYLLTNGEVWYDKKGNVKKEEV